MTRTGWLADTAVMRADCSSRSTCRAASPSSMAPLICPSSGNPMTETMPTSAVTISSSISENPDCRETLTTASHTAIQGPL